jgi:hypothetical protein
LRFSLKNYFPISHYLQQSFLRARLKKENTALTHRVRDHKKKKEVFRLAFRRKRKVFASPLPRSMIHTRKIVNIFFSFLSSRTRPRYLCALLSFAFPGNNLEIFFLPSKKSAENIYSK